jgi:tRNA(adenine34) deaminase
MEPTSEADRRHLARCLALAREAGARGEVPIGALVVAGAEVIGEAGNRCEELRSPLAHAELQALQAAFARAGEGRIPGAVLYCTLEPCFMCTGAALHARVARIVFATRDPKFGACGSLACLPSDARLNHRCAVHEGLFAEESAALLREFFRRLR